MAQDPVMTCGSTPCQSRWTARERVTGPGGINATGRQNSRPIAYSAEFALHQSLPIYAGGLGVLAGDHCKEASDLGVPLVAVGFMYPQGYFHQRTCRPTAGSKSATRKLDLDRTRRSSRP